MKRTHDIGPEIVAAREAGVRWKVLMQKYGLSRSRLYQLWRQARATGDAISPLP